jgi:hypothetical protein
MSKMLKVIGINIEHQISNLPAGRQVLNIEVRNFSVQY